MKCRSSFLALAVFVTISCAILSTQSAEFNHGGPVLPSALQFISASDPRFRYEGRIDVGNSEAPVIIWEGSRIVLDFEGPQLFLRWGHATEQNFFDVQVDAEKEIIGVISGVDARIAWPHPLTPGRHRLTVFKRSEATAGQVEFAGVEIGTGLRAWIPSLPDYRLRMEFYGDSITAGACDEDGEKDQWDDRRTHNFAFSYATLTAIEFGAELRCEAVSGIGVVTGWTEMTSGQIWDRIYPRKNSPIADMSWQPDVLFINLGDNDDDFPRSRHQPFPTGFTPAYVGLVQAIRAANPQAHLVLLMGGMYSGARSMPLRKAWLAAVGQLEAADPSVSHFIFTHWSSNHPRVIEHRILAEELNAWLKLQPFMKRFL